MNRERHLTAAGGGTVLAFPAILILILMSLPAPARAQQTPNEQARSLLEDGRTYRKDGKLKQALDNFNTIVTGFSSTDSVDDALLEIGRYHLEVESDVTKAREAFDQVAKRFPQSDGAPGAYYNLGWLTMTRATSLLELDDAVAQFTRVERLYPRSEWVPRALYALGLAHRKAGRLPAAVDAERRVALEYPSSDVAPAAQFQIGHVLALMGEPKAAMEEFQQVRNRFDESEWAPRALDRITALYRLHGAGKPVFAVDPAFNAGGGDVLKDVRALLMTPARTLWIASDKVKGAVPMEPGGKMGPSLHGEDLRTLSLSPKGDVVLASRLVVRIGPRDVRSFAAPGDKPGLMEPLEKITAAAVTQGGSILVADEKKKVIHRYDGPNLEYKGTFPADAKPREVARIVIDGEGAIVILDKDAKTVQAFDETGKALWSIAGRGAGYEMRKPSDVAVDAFRNVYVADEEGSVLVFTPKGALLTAVTADEVKKPKTLTVEPAGAVLVYDDRLERVVRFK